MHPDTELDYPFPTPPGAGEIVAVADGILWTRMPLPFRLDHVNIFLIADEGGWAVVDTGIGDAATIETWQRLLAGPLAGARVTRLIVTHFHPDHIGAAGWLCERFDAPLLTSQTGYLGCINISLSPGAMDARTYRDFYLSHGLAPEIAALVGTQGHAYLRMVMPVPPTFRRLVAGDRLDIGGRRFEVMSGEGHAAEQIMLYCREEGLFLGADQVIAKITPNVSVWAVEPDGDPLGLYLRSLGAIRATVDADVLVLPGHQLPFYGLHLRCDQLIDHHEVRCAAILESCADGPKSVADLVPVLFKRALDPHQFSFAFSETHAHVNALVARGELAWTRDLAGRKRVVQAGAA